jgi:hypothetical protein
MPLLDDVQTAYVAGSMTVEELERRLDSIFSDDPWTLQLYGDFDASGPWTRIEIANPEDRYDTFKFRVPPHQPRCQVDGVYLVSPAGDIARTIELTPTRVLGGDWIDLTITGP